MDTLLLIAQITESKSSTEGKFLKELNGLSWPRPTKLKEIRRSIGNSSSTFKVARSFSMDSDLEAFSHNPTHVA